jgi:hypothetical protein
MGAMDDLADRLDAGVDAMLELGPQLAAGEPWGTDGVVAPGPESSWGPREVLAHVGEMLPFWLGEIELILDAGGGAEPLAFGRLEADDIRIAIITRDRAFPARELLSRVESEGRRVSRRFRAFGATEATTIGRHVTRGDLTVREIAERLVVGHLEAHVTQLRDAVGANA